MSTNRNWRMIRARSTGSTVASERRTRTRLALRKCECRAPRTNRDLLVRVKQSRLGLAVVIRRQGARFGSPGVSQTRSPRRCLGIARKPLPRPWTQTQKIAQASPALTTSTQPSDRSQLAHARDWPKRIFRALARVKLAGVRDAETLVEPVASALASEASKGIRLRLVASVLLSIPCACLLYASGDWRYAHGPSWVIVLVCIAVPQLVWNFDNFLAPVSPRWVVRFWRTLAAFGLLGMLMTSPDTANRTPLHFPALFWFSGLVWYLTEFVAWLRWGLLGPSKSAFVEVLTGLVAAEAYNQRRAGSSKVLKRTQKKLTARLLGQVCRRVEHLGAPATRHASAATLDGEAAALPFDARSVLDSVLQLYQRDAPHIDERRYLDGVIRNIKGSAGTITTGTPLEVALATGVAILGLAWCLLGPAREQLRSVAALEVLATDIASSPFLEARLATRLQTLLTAATGASGAGPDLWQRGDVSSSPATSGLKLSGYGVEWDSSAMFAFAAEVMGIGPRRVSAAIRNLDGQTTISLSVKGELVSTVAGDARQFDDLWRRSADALLPHLLVPRDRGFLTHEYCLVAARNLRNEGFAPTARVVLVTCAKMDPQYKSQDPEVVVEHALIALEMDQPRRAETLSLTVLDQARDPRVQQFRHSALQVAAEASLANGTPLRALATLDLQEKDDHLPLDRDEKFLRVRALRALGRRGEAWTEIQQLVSPDDEPSLRGFWVDMFAAAHESAAHNSAKARGHFEHAERRVKNALDIAWGFWARLTSDSATRERYADLVLHTPESLPVSLEAAADAFTKMGDVERASQALRNLVQRVDADGERATWGNLAHRTQALSRLCTYEMTEGSAGNSTACATLERDSPLGAALVASWHLDDPATRLALEPAFTGVGTSEMAPIDTLMARASDLWVKGRRIQAIRVAALLALGQQTNSVRLGVQLADWLEELADTHQLPRRPWMSNVSEMLECHSMPKRLSDSRSECVTAPSPALLLDLLFEVLVAERAFDVAERLAILLARESPELGPNVRARILLGRLTWTDGAIVDLGSIPNRETSKRVLSHVHALDESLTARSGDTAVDDESRDQSRSLLASLLAISGNLEGARSAIQPILGRDLRETHWAVARIASLARDGELLLKALKSMVALAPDDPRPHAAMALLAYHNGDVRSGHTCEKRLQELSVSDAVLQDLEKAKRGHMRMSQPQSPASFIRSAAKVCEYRPLSQSGMMHK